MTTPREEALEALKATNYTASEDSHNAKMVRQAIAALESQPPESAATEGMMEPMVYVFEIDVDGEGDREVDFVTKRDYGDLLARRLSESHPMVSREAIGRAFETANPDALEKEEYDFSAGFDAIHALQLPAPSAPSSSDVAELIRVATNAESYMKAMGQNTTMLTAALAKLKEAR